jgi:hypothetical protein
MPNRQTKTPPSRGSRPKRDWTVLVAIIGAFATVAAALIAHATWTTHTSSVTVPPSTSPGYTAGRPVAPQLDFVPASSGKVPWCNNFYIKATGQLPAGYRILIFDASSDARFNTVSNYSYGGAVTPVKGITNEWETPDLWLGTKYKTDDNGNPVLRAGKNASNAGYTVVVFAVLVPTSVVQILEDAIPKGHILLTQLPSEMIKEAEFDATRTGDVQQCPDFASQN